MNNRDKAKELMRTYLSMIAGAAELELTEGHLEEINELVDCLIDAAKEEIEAAQEPNDMFEDHQRMKRIMAGMA